MIKGDMTVREWMENQKKANEKLALDIIDQKQNQIDKLEEENKKLREELEKWKKDYREGNIVDARNG